MRRICAEIKQSRARVLVRTGSGLVNREGWADVLKRFCGNRRFVDDLFDLSDGLLEKWLHTDMRHLGIRGMYPRAEGNLVITHKQYGGPSPESERSCETIGMARNTTADTGSAGI